MISRNPAFERKKKQLRTVILKKNYWYLLEISNLIIRYSAGANQTLKAPIFFTVIFKKYVIFDFGNSELTFKRKGSQWNFIKIMNKLLIWALLYFMFVFSVDAVHLINLGHYSATLSFIFGFELGHHFERKLKFVCWSFC